MKQNHCPYFNQDIKQTASFSIKRTLSAWSCFSISWVRKDGRIFDYTYRRIFESLTWQTKTFERDYYPIFWIGIVFLYYLISFRSLIYNTFVHMYQYKPVDWHFLFDLFEIEKRVLKQYLLSHVNLYFASRQLFLSREIIFLTFSK